MKIAQFDYRVKTDFILTLVFCVQNLLLVLFFVRKQLGNFSLICFTRTAPSLKSAEIQWAFERESPKNLFAAQVL